MENRPYIGTTIGRLADDLLRLAAPTSESGRGRIKLPPQFLPSERRGRQAAALGRKRLVAFLSTLADYEEGDGSPYYPTLAELPARFASYTAHVGAPIEGENPSLRRIHNWVHQVGFGVRAAVLESEISSVAHVAGILKAFVTRDVDEAAVERTMRRLYTNPRRAFVACAPDNHNAYKPLREAPVARLRGWIGEEAAQRRAGISEGYGAEPLPEDWDQFGSGPARTVCAAILANVRRLRESAVAADAEGRWNEADTADNALMDLDRSLAFLI